jgi:hypothetical protein
MLCFVRRKFLAAARRLRRPLSPRSCSGLAILLDAFATA